MSLTAKQDREQLPGLPCAGQSLLNELSPGSQLLSHLHRIEKVKKTKSKPPFLFILNIPVKYTPLPSIHFRFLATNSQHVDDSTKKVDPPFGLWIRNQKTKPAKMQGESCFSAPANRASKNHN